MSKPLTMDQFENNTAKEWASGAYHAEIQATIEAYEGCRQNLVDTLESESRNIARALKAEADNARLRALIKGAEQGDGRQAVTTGFCPWCECSPGAHFRCPAFTDEGHVR